MTNQLTDAQMDHALPNTPTPPPPPRPPTPSPRPLDVHVIALHSHAQSVSLLQALPPSPRRPTRTHRCSLPCPQPPAPINPSACRARLASVRRSTRSFWRSATAAFLTWTPTGVSLGHQFLVAAVTFGCAGEWVGQSLTGERGVHLTICPARSDSALRIEKGVKACDIDN